MKLPYKTLVVILPSFILNTSPLHLRHPTIIPSTALKFLFTVVYRFHYSIVITKVHFIVSDHILLRIFQKR